MYKNLSKWHPIIYDSDKFIDYISLKDYLLFDSTEIRNYFYTIINFNKLINWILITTEENSNGNLHLHGVISYGNLMDYNRNISTNILGELKNKYYNIDIVFKDINKFKDIKNWIKYLHTNKTQIFPPIFIIKEEDSKFLKKTFELQYLSNYNLKNNFKVELDKYYKTNMILGIEILEEFTEYNEDVKKIKSIAIYKNEISENLFIDLILNYLILCDLYIYKENVYRKIKSSLISYEMVGTIKDVLFDNFENNVILYFKLNFHCQFEGFDFYYLIKTYKNQMENNIIKIKNISSNKINLNFSYMEFTDGVYFIGKNKFIPRDKFNNKNIQTIKYYKKSYNWIRQNKPINWINGLKNAIGIDNAEGFTLICLFLSTLFQNKCEDNKKNFLYIHGKTNTGKSTYLTKVLTRYYGIDNVGNIVNSTNFKFQDLYEKLLVIMDEFRYSSGSSSDFLKLLGGEPLLTTQKYSKNHILINKVMGVILSNYLFQEKNDSVQKALMERLFVVEFLNSVNKDLVNINEVLQDEEPSIIIFCNKVYFSCKVRKINFKLDQKELIKK